jgi:L-threonylcarbamoyladenylate synthase
MRISRDILSLVQRAAGVISSGGLVIVPSETFYALAADPFNQRAVERIFSAKARAQEKPLPLIASNKKAVVHLTGNPPANVERLMDEFWPGSLTILFPCSIPVSPLLTSAHGKIAIRVPPICGAVLLAERVGGFVTATSANLSGDPSPDRISSVSKTLLGSVDLVIDLGETPGGLPSTLVDLVDGQIRIIREGAVSISRIRQALCD